MGGPGTPSDRNPRSDQQPPRQLTLQSLLPRDSNPALSRRGLSLSVSHHAHVVIRLCDVTRGCRPHLPRHLTGHTCMPLRYPPACIKYTQAPFWSCPRTQQHAATAAQPLDATRPPSLLCPGIQIYRTRPLDKDGRRISNQDRAWGPTMTQRRSQGAIGEASASRPSRAGQTWRMTYIRPLWPRGIIPGTRRVLKSRRFPVCPVPEYLTKQYSVVPHVTSRGLKNIEVTTSRTDLERKCERKHFTEIYKTPQSQSITSSFMCKKPHRRPVFTPIGLLVSSSRHHASPAPLS